MNTGGFYSWLGVGAQPNYNTTGDGIFSDDFSWIKGRHVIQVGGLYMWNILRLNSSAFSQGNFTFSGAHTNDPAGDFMLGQLASYSQSNIQRFGTFHQHWFDLYAQDDWKVTPRLTLSYGVRYSYYSPTVIEGNQVSNFNASTFVAANAPAVSTTARLTSTVPASPSPPPARSRTSSLTVSSSPG